MGCARPVIATLQSHVLETWVGNRAAVPAIELLGGLAVAVPTVIFTTHGGRPGARGAALPEEMLAQGIRHMLEANPVWLLVGYLGSKANALALLKEIRTRPELRDCLLVDPVIGDWPKGRYVPEELADVIVGDLVPLAGVITPNAFEAEYLTGLPLDSPENIIQVVSKLHRMGPGRVLITSVIPGQAKPGSRFDKLETAGQPGLKPDKTGYKLYNVASDGQEIVLIEAPLVTGQVHGAGDMLGAGLATLFALGYNWRTAAQLVTAMVTRAVRASVEQGLDTVDPYQGILGQFYRRPYKLAEEEVQEILKQAGIVTYPLHRRRDMP